MSWDLEDTGGGCLVFNFNSDQGSFMLSDEYIAFLPEGVTTKDYDENPEMTYPLHLVSLSGKTSISTLWDILSQHGHGDQIKEVIQNWIKLTRGF
jgi:hypothetical protein